MNKNKMKFKRLTKVWKKNLETLNNNPSKIMINLNSKIKS